MRTVAEFVLLGVALALMGTLLHLHGHWQWIELGGSYGTLLLSHIVAEHLPHLPARREP